MYAHLPFFGSRKYAGFIHKSVRPAIDVFMLILLMFLLVRVVVVIGFKEHTWVLSHAQMQYYNWAFRAMGVLYLMRSLICLGFKNIATEFYLFASISLFLFVSFFLDIEREILWLNNHYFYALLTVVLLVLELSHFDMTKITLALNPAQLFIASFGLLILIGTGLLMLPNATTSPITVVDALFTSTSAICVTGLIVVDTATQFTFLGKSIILLLIQTGGIGIMTFTSFFGFFFRGGSASFSERLAMSDFFSVDNISEIGKTLVKVIFITFMFEIAGAAILYFSLDHAYFTTIGERIRFSVFHSISAFCNAGFSTFTDGLYDFRVRGTYPVLYVVSFLVILGGIGFPILLNLYTYLKYKFQGLISIVRFGKRKATIPMMINVNSKLVIFTTGILIVVGMLSFFMFEKNNTLEGMDVQGKIAHAFFGSVTPRTAGFNTVNMGHLSMATIALTIFLMWIGASPVSTGGGIKTSTFAVAMLNVLRVARVRAHIAFNRREFHERSVDRAFAIVILSILIIGSFALVIYLLEPDLRALHILFECVSAFGTVGLSLGVTPNLGDMSKLLITVLMFMGRMGVLTLLFAALKSAGSLAYRYPKEQIIVT